ncbi:MULTISPECIES: hypothetical protein [Bacillus cereus group]|uniref:hypothetical protein n=1 Tax=Bacillus cereus group TaxID=86661 RepID=UPI0020D2716F|nr:hypothetical protein [Bacillus thuringiensis]MCQ6335067.1 hypothetical protein [Bacillus cereus]
MNKSNRLLPVLLAYGRDGNGKLTVWCPYCATWHLHEQEEGHRSKIGEVHLLKQGTL